MTTNGLRSRLRAGLESFYPGYFALVMATSIVSLASHAVGLPPVIAESLLALNVGLFALLSLILVARIVCFPARVFADLCDHGRGPGFFTVVAGSCVLGSNLLIVAGANEPARILWWVGLCLWVLVMYGFFAATIIREKKPTLVEGINGAWLIATVATQGIATLGGALSPFVSDDTRAPLLFFCLVMYLLGAGLYLTIITLIFYRFTFIELPIAKLTPPYWINMGAVAITTLAGSTLLMVTDSSALLIEIEPFVIGFTLFFWATATWWIPLLLILGVYRHVVRRFPLQYDPQYWGMAFPIGMYTFATWRLAHELELDFLKAVPEVFVYPALLTWALTFAGMLGHIWRLFRGSEAA